MTVEPEIALDYAKLEQSRAYKIYSRAVKNQVTLKQYNYYLRAFLRYAHLTSYDELISCNSEKIQELLENWMMDMVDRGVKGTSIRTRLAPIFMSFLGGILMYLAVKDENKEMANDAMFIALVSTIGWGVLYVLIMVIARRSFPF